MNEPTYVSIFQNEFSDLVKLKRALGFRYDTGAVGFKRIDSFFINKQLSDKCITKELCENWCQKRSYESVSNQNHRISTMRVFCNYLKGLGFSVYVPSKGISKKPPRYAAHIYSDDELIRFFSAVDKSQSVPRECPYRGMIMPVFFRILYTSGMRVSELRMAKLEDVNLTEGYITVHEAKNHKDRIVPIHPSILPACITIRKEIHAGSAENEFFFMIRPGQAMSLANVYKNFRRYLEKAGISHTGHGPRLHDFRHTYCVNLLRKWVDEGKDLMAYLPYMKTMLGHESFEETAYYLKLTSERYPYIKNQIKTSFPNLIREAVFEEHEFY